MSLDAVVVVVVAAAILATVAAFFSASLRSNQLHAWCAFPCSTCLSSPPFPCVSPPLFFRRWFLEHICTPNTRHSAAKYGFKGKEWAGASEESKHFVRSLLLKNPALRLTAADAQKHGWLKGAEDLSQAPKECADYRNGVTQSLLDFR